MQADKFVIFLFIFIFFIFFLVFIFFYFFCQKGPFFIFFYFFHSNFLFIFIFFTKCLYFIQNFRLRRAIFGTIKKKFACGGPIFFAPTRNFFSLRHVDCIKNKISKSNVIQVPHYKNTIKTLKDTFLTHKSLFMKINVNIFIIFFYFFLFFLRFCRYFFLFFFAMVTCQPAKGGGC